MTNRRIGIGLLGYAFMGKAHSHAFKDLPHFFWPVPAIPKMVILCGRNEEKTKIAAENFGFKKFTTDWKKVVEDKEVEIVDNSLPNDMHAEPSIKALEAGKNVICEKPLARNSQEAKEMLETARKSDAKTMVAFNYRFVPAVVLARNIVRSGDLGKIYHFRARYLQDWLVNPQSPVVWRLVKERAGSGPLGDLGSHIADLARFILGEIRAVNGITKTFIDRRPLIDDSTKKGIVDVEDAFASTVEFENGAIGTLEASRFAFGRKNYNNFEINGENGSIEFNLERLNELRLYSNEGAVDKRGWNEILVTDRSHPYISHYWPSGHIIGWEHTFINEIYHFIDAVVNDKKVEPYGATFEDGYRNMVILDSIIKSAENGKRISIAF